VQMEDAAAMLRACKAGNAKPRAYLYRYTDPISGNPIWRSDNAFWNGQRPSEVLPLYEHPPAPDHAEWNDAIEEAAKVAREMADLHGPNGSEAYIRQLKKGQTND